MRIPIRAAVPLIVASAILTCSATVVEAKKGKRKDAQSDPYAEYVWPAPPDEPRIKLETVIAGRADVTARKGWRRKLLQSAPQTIYDRLKKPFAVAFDARGRILVTDSATGALIRFDREGRRMDVLGTRGAVHLVSPKGLDVGSDGTIYVADVGVRKVLAFDPEGSLVAAYGKQNELVNPTDVALSPDGTRLYVADSKAHEVVVFHRVTGERIASFGERGEGEGQFGFPTSLAIGPEGELYVVDQINSRIQVFDPDGEYVDQFGRLGVGFADFVRPKDVAVDEEGLIYVTDNAYNNVQLFDADFTLLTFVGEAGETPGRFLGASGVAVQGDRFAVVDQLGRRLQVFRFIVPRDQ